MPDFINGLALSRAFFFEVVSPILKSVDPTLQYSAGLIGRGSEVLGFDTEMSMDHDWGPRVLIFHRLEDRERCAKVSEALTVRLPSTFRGFPTSFTLPDPADGGTQVMAESQAGLVNHRVEFDDISGFCEKELGRNLTVDLPLLDWLAIPSQRLRSVVSGDVFRDDLDLDALRNRCSWYPDDIWIYLMACTWQRLSQEEHLAGRAASVGDEIGWRIIVARIVRDIMRLTFLMSRGWLASVLSLPFAG
ncbi:MAG: DUF4037 domain-containing protein [Pseudomonadota bacterium]